MGVSRGDFNPPHRVAGPSAAPPHAAAYLAAQPDPKPHPRPVKPEGNGLSRAPSLEQLVAVMLHLAVVGQRLARRRHQDRVEPRYGLVVHGRSRPDAAARAGREDYRV